MTNFRGFFFAIFVWRIDGHCFTCNCRKTHFGKARCKVLLLFWYATQMKCCHRFGGSRMKGQKSDVDERWSTSLNSRGFFAQLRDVVPVSLTSGLYMCKASSMRFPNWCEWNWWYTFVYRRYNRLAVRLLHLTDVWYICANVYSKKREPLSMCPMHTHTTWNPLWRRRY